MTLTDEQVDAALTDAIMAMPQRTVTQHQSDHAIARHFYALGLAANDTELRAARQDAARYKANYGAVISTLCHSCLLRLKPANAKDAP